LWHDDRSYIEGHGVDGEALVLLRPENGRLLIKLLALRHTPLFFGESKRPFSPMLLLYPRQ
jgi:hypothetical protein